MTQHGSFKRVVRAHARATGRRYTEALDELQRIDTPFADTRPVDTAALARHLESRYGIRIEALAPIDDDPATRPRGSWSGHYPSTILVRRSDGAPWIARVHTSDADRVSRVEGDAEILRFLADNGYPAERIADEHPVSELEGGAVLVTEFLEGGRPTDDHGRVRSPGVFRELGALLGRLHVLPEGGGATARDGGSEEHDGGFHVGRPGRDLVAAMGFLIDVEGAVPPDGRGAFDALGDLVEQCDDAEGLPEALTHGNFHAWAAVGHPNALSIVGWAGSGRGPRLPALAWLTTTAAEGGLENVDAVVRGYGEQMRPSTEELERLAGVMRIRPLWLACLDYRQAVRSGRAPVAGDGWSPTFGVDDPERFARIADRVTAALG